IPLIARVGQNGFAVLCTSGTVTSANLAEQRLPNGAIHQFVILDTPRFVNRFFDHWRPDLALFVESDLWPNLIVTSAQRGIPLVFGRGVGCGVFLRGGGARAGHSGGGAARFRSWPRALARAGGAIRGVGGPAHRPRGQSKFRGAGPPRRSRQAGAVALRD